MPAGALLPLQIRTVVTDANPESDELYRTRFRMQLLLLSDVLRQP